MSDILAPVREIVQRHKAEALAEHDAEITEQFKEHRYRKKPYSLTFECWCAGRWEESGDEGCEWVFRWTERCEIAEGRESR